MEFFHATVPPAFVGWYLGLWGVFTLFMWFDTFTANRAVRTVFFLLLPNHWNRYIYVRLRSRSY